jgi:putative oxidoreductase
MIDELSDIDEGRLIIPGLAGVYRAIAPFAYALVRVLTALSLLPVSVDRLVHGSTGELVGAIAALGFAFPTAWAWAVILVESVGGIMLGLGLFTRPVAFAIAVEMTVIGFGIMIKRGLFWPAHGLEVALLLALVTFAYVLGGGGRYSLDRVIGREF